MFHKAWLGCSQRKALIWGCVWLLLSGCQSSSYVPGAAVIRDVERDRGVRSIPAGPGEPVRARGAEAMPAGEAVERVGRSAVLALNDRAQQLLRSGDWWAAIDTAERGLRIDRRNPDFYAVLNQAYDALGKSDKALEFARQGVRFCSSERHACGIMRQYLYGK